MRQPDDSALVLHMLMLARRVRDHTERLSHEDFAADDNLQLATMLAIQSIGEAARRTSEEFRTGHPEIDWPAIIGMRQRLPHEHVRVSIDLVWATAVIDIPALIALFEPLVPRDGGAETP